MNLGISILFEKPKKEPPQLFSFMSPFSSEVWLWLGLALFLVSLSLFIMGRLSPAEWDNPYPCIEEPEELENQFSFQNSVWFSIGELVPIYFCHPTSCPTLQVLCCNKEVKLHQSKLKSFSLTLILDSNFQSAINSNCGVHVVVLHSHHGFILHCKLGCFLDH